jgi:release factor glutamine methyltransferase
VSDPVPLASLIRDGTDRLRHAGLREPRRKALRLWADLMDDDHAGPVLAPERQVAGDEAERFREAVIRRAAGEPLAYISGQAGFRRLTLRVDRRVLIPRPETEGLVERLLARAPEGRVADIGTGSGCIALSLAQEGGYHEVIAVDRSPAALAVARENAGEMDLPVTLVRSDLTSALASGSLDALAANPPYLTEAEYRALDPGVRAWEPEAALASGADGLEATFRLLDDARRVLRPGGWLALEVDCTRAVPAARRAGALGWTAVEIQSDLFGRERYLLARRSTAP